MLINSRKGGVTIYIIIGIVILLMGVITIVYSDNIHRFYLESRNPEAKDVRLFVENCLETQTKEAIQIASLQGGYTQIPSVLNNRGSYLPPASLLEPPFKTPYWWDNGVSYVPSEERVQIELANYVRDNIKSCLFFEQFNSIDVEVGDEINVETKLSTNSVSSRLELPLTITIGENNVKLQNFAKEIKTSFPKLYEAAKEIMQVENEKAFLETLTMDMIASANGAGDSPHLPLDGYEVRCGEGNKWSIQTQIIPTIQNLVKYNFHFLSFEGTKPDYDINFEDNREITQEVCQAESDGVCTKFTTQKSNIFDYYTKRTERFDGSASYIQKLNSKKDFSDIRVKLEYDDSFPMNLDVTPSRGDTVKGANLDIPVIGSCFKIYHHFYTINYPVMFQLTDEVDGNVANSGLTFAFATGVNIENNQPKRTVSPYSAGDFIYSPDIEQYCENRNNPQDVFVKDEVTSEFIDGAKISYQCVRFNCELGETSSPTLDGVPIPGSPTLRTGFPSCVNGFMIVEKESYQDNFVQVTVDSSTQSLSVVELTPMKELELRVIVVEKNNNQLSLRDIRDDESVLVSIAKSDQTHDDVALYKNNIDEEFRDNLKFILEDGEYQLDAKLIDDSSSGGQNVGLSGGLFIDKWQVSRNELSSAKIMKVYVIAPSGITDTDSYINAWNNQIVPQSGEFAPIFE